MKRKLYAALTALLVIAGLLTAPAANATPITSGCSLHIVYTLYPYADDYPYTTTSYAGYRYFVTHNLGVASYGWYC
jgi:hypothetical protein